MTNNAIRANAVAILRAASVRGIGYRCWKSPYPDIQNWIKFSVRRDPFGCKVSGASSLFWSEFRPLPKGVEEVRKGLFAPMWRQAMKATARNLIHFTNR